MSSTPPPGIPGAGLFGSRFECSVEVPNENASLTRPADHPLLPNSLTLRIFFNPIQAVGLFRLQANVALDPGPDAESGPVHPFYLQLLPEHIHSLRLDKSSLYFHQTDPGVMTLLGPAAIPVGDAALKTSALRAMAWLSQQLSIVMHLPARASTHVQALTTLCEAISSSGPPLSADPFHTDLRSLYSGQGGRIIALDEILDDGTDDVPPVYADVAPPAPPAPVAPLSPGPSMRKFKRPRTISPSESDMHSSRQLLDTRHAQVLAELVRQLDKKENCIRALMEDMDAKSTRAAQQMKEMDEQVQRLKELTDAAASKLEASAAAPGPAASGLEHPADIHSSSRRTQAASSSPSPSIASAISSRPSRISTRVQAYIERRLETLRGELLAHNEEYVDNTVADHATTEEMQTYVDNLLSDYATVAAMESHVSDELDGVLSNHVEEFQMYEAITEAVDEAVEGIRERILAAWDV